MTYDTFIPCLHLVPLFTHTNLFTQMSAAFPLSINSQHTGNSSFLHTTCMHYRLIDAHSTLLWREQHLVPRLLLRKMGRNLATRLRLSNDLLPLPLVARNNFLNSLKESTLINASVELWSMCKKLQEHIGEANTGHVPQMRTWPFPTS